MLLLRPGTLNLQPNLMILLALSDVHVGLCESANRSHAFLGILRDCLAEHQSDVKSAKTCFISNLVSKNSHKPHYIQLKSIVCTTVFQQYKPGSLSELSMVVQKLRLSQYPLDTIPPRQLKDIFHNTGSYISTMINISLTSGCVPNVLSML